MLLYMFSSATCKVSSTETTDNTRPPLVYFWLLVVTTFDSYNLTVAADGSEKIHGSTDDLTVATERAAFTLVFTDSTQGWLLTNN